MILFGAELTQVVSRARRGTKDKGGTEPPAPPTEAAKRAEALPTNDVDALPPKESKP